MAVKASPKPLLHTTVYTALNTFAPILSATAYGIPKSPEAIDNAPNVLNAVCHAYPAEYPTPIPPIIRYMDKMIGKQQIQSGK